mmetsp:Transcript_34996/g.35547  ORF Transcript_34996/g.35547 Transcript_34996/m.35547 type:complete len:245 (+) Transcript_34996:82-816(+)
MLSDNLKQDDERPPTPTPPTLTLAAFIDKQVLLHSLKTVALNGRTGVVLTTAADNPERVQVLLAESQTGRGDSKTISLKPTNLEIIDGDDDDNEDNNDTVAVPVVVPALAAQPTTTTTTNKPFRPTAMNGYPGKFKLGYDWREVLPEQAIPRGLETMISLDAGIPTIARIPQKWRVDVFLDRTQHVRFEVGRTTTVDEVIQQTVELLPAAQGVTQLTVDGITFEGKGETTVEKAALFGKKITVV